MKGLRLLSHVRVPQIIRQDHMYIAVCLSNRIFEAKKNSMIQSLGLVEIRTQGWFQDLEPIGHRALLTKLTRLVTP